MEFEYSPAIDKKVDNIMDKLSGTEGSNNINRFHHKIRVKSLSFLHKCSLFVLLILDEKF